MTFEDFKAELAALCPVHRAKAVVDAIHALPVGTRLAHYVREPGKDRWREEYTSTKRRRDGRTEIVKHAAYTGAWSVAMDVGFAPAHRAKDAEAIAFAAYQVMVPQGITSLPAIADSPPPIAQPVYEPLPPPPPAAPLPAPRRGEQFTLPF